MAKVTRTTMTARREKIVVNQRDKIVATRVAAEEAAKAAWEEK